MTARACAELYLHAHAPANVVSLYRSGTRVLGDLAEVEAFARMPWTSGYVQGIIDAPYLNLTPGTRLGVTQDAALAQLADELAPLEARLAKIVDAQPRAEEERASRDVLHDLAFAWSLLEGEGSLDHAGGELATYRAGVEPGLARVEVVVTQGEVVCRAEAQITVTASLLPKPVGGDSAYQGLPGYTYHKAAGELWRSRFDAERNLVVINNGHRDFVYAARGKTLKLRYICRLFAKELVLKNFVGIPPDQLLERLLELTLYTEEHLR